MWPNPQKTADLVTFTEEILTGKLHFLCSGRCYSKFIQITFLRNILLYNTRGIPVLIKNTEAFVTDESFPGTLETV